ncbi:tetratricopeptide repeat protein [Chitinimonas arctica]|uniref:Tetratricopeptide repeat protein n=1 Tax=Chitinimonas arctica TaxID=2594795 RepID=A0A516SKL5_9NEIS|nr:tetratricopeptide repeat protein [Chitinimonas arctica]QDQ28701.1 tetratricopeptide repeat protein [Chitinimonas arctica]
MSTLYRYRFGSSLLDESTGELIVNGLSVNIQPQSFRLLGLLLSHRGELVSYSEIEEYVWHGRRLGDNVLASAITRLRAALGETNAGLIEAVPRIGYRITATVERSVARQSISSKLELSKGQDVAMRPGFTLERMLGQGSTGEVWLARNAKTGILRVFKFVSDGNHLTGLKREATLSRVLYEQLGECNNLLRIVDWSFETSPFFIESEYGGDNLLIWSQVENILDTMPTESRIALFLQIAHGVAAAHSVGVIHKDIKPANVLVSSQGGGWQVRLADFGSGRLTDHDRLAELGFTAMSMSGAPTVLSDEARGTIMYVAPEIFREQPATERSDVFALGVLLYQMLVGDLRRPMVPGWEREIADALLVEEIAHSTDGDPTRRTATVDAMIERLSSLSIRHQERLRHAAEQEQALLNQDIARRARARRPWVIGFVAALALGLLISLQAYMQLRNSEALLSRQIKNVEALNQFLTEDLIGQSSPARTGRADITIQEAAVLAAAKIDHPSFGYSPEVRAILHAAMQSNFDGLKNYKAEAVESEKALAALAQLAEPNSEQLSLVRIFYANSLRNLTRLKEATAQLDLVEKSIAQHSAVTQARYWFVRGLMGRSNYQWEEARRNYDRALELLKGQAGARPALSEDIEYHAAQATRLLRDFPAAERMSRALLQKTTARYGNAHYVTCIATQGLGETLTSQGRFEESIPTMQAALDCVKKAAGEEAIATARVAQGLAAAYFSNHQWDDALRVHQFALAIFEKLNGRTALDAISTRASIGRDYAFAGRPELARPFFHAALADARKSFNESHPLVHLISFQLADCLLELKEKQGVAELLDHLDVKQLNRSNPGTSWHPRLRYEQGRLALLNGNKQLAIELLESAANELEAIARSETDKRPHLYSSHRVRKALAEARG